MRALVRKIYRTLLVYGFDAKVFLKAFKRKEDDWFYKDLKTLKQQKGDDTSFKIGPLYPILTDRNTGGGTSLKVSGI